jgi:hypothetical protein
LGLNRLRPQGLKEYSDGYLIMDYLGPVLGSKCLVMQTMGIYLGLSRTRTFGGDLREDVSGCHPDFQPFILFFLYVYLLVSLLWLVYIVKPLYHYGSVLKSTLLTPNSFLNLSPQFWTFVVHLKLGPLGATRAQHTS